MLLLFFEVVIFMVVGLVSCRRGQSDLVSSITVGVLFFVTGGFLLQLHYDWQDTLATRYAERSFAFIGNIEDITDRETQDRGQVIRFCASTVHTADGNEQPVNFRLLIYTTRKLKHILVGDCVRFSDIHFLKTDSQRMTDAPSFHEYLLKEQILGSVFAYGSINCVLISRPQYSITRWLWQLRECIYQACKRKLTPLTFSYVALIFFGNKYQDNSEDLRNMFSYWGLSHYLARAGLHIILFILVWEFFFHFLPIYVLFKRLMLIMMCVTYGLLSWYSIPFGRALISFLLAEAGAFLGHRPTFFHTLTLLCCLVLLLSPLQLFFLDFQLTFGLTFALSWYGNLVFAGTQEV